MDSSISLKDQIWFLRVCHHILFSLYLVFVVDLESDVMMMWRVLTSPPSTSILVLVHITNIFTSALHSSFPGSTVSRQPTSHKGPFSTESSVLSQ